MLLKTEALSCESVCWFPGAGVQGLQNSQVKSTIHAVARGEVLNVWVSHVQSLPKG